MEVRRLLKQISKNYVNQQVMYLLVSFSNSNLSLRLIAAPKALSRGEGAQCAHWAGVEWRALAARKKPATMR